MATYLERIKSAKYLATDGTNIYTSSDLTNFTDLKTLNNGNYTDIQILKIGDWYYLIGTLCFFKTQDFTTFTDIDISLINDGSYTDISHLRLFEDANNKYHISYKATNDNNTTFIYIADFNTVNDSISNAYQKVTVSDSNCNACFIYTYNKYYLFLDDTDIYVSDNYLDNFSEVATNITNDSSNTYMDSYVFMDTNYVYLTQVVNDDTVTYRRASKYNLIVWSNEATISGLSTSMGIYLNNYASSLETEEEDLDGTFDPIVIVKSINETQKSVLTCLLWSTFEVQWTKNSSWQITFTAYDDGSPSYSLLSVEASVYFNGQEFIVKTCEYDYAEGVNTKQITATHIYNELQYVKQSNSTSDTLTYTVEEVLEYYLGSDNSTANYRGFSYSVYGDFEKQQISSMGGNSAKDGLSTIISTWTNAIVFPDNLVINVYTPEEFEKAYGRRIDYLNNAKSVTLTIDSTSVTNQVYCVGKSYENSDDNSTTEYYFTPFTYTDEDSVSTWKLHPHDDINDERFTDADSMKEYAISQLQPDPAVSAEIDDLTNDVPIPGEVRHLKVNDDYETDVMLIGYTWYPFSPANVTVLEFDNLPANILNTTAKLNNQMRSVQLLTQEALNKASTATTNYFSSTDPTKNTSVRVGDIWTRELTT